MLGRRPLQNLTPNPADEASVIVFPHDILWPVPCNPNTWAHRSFLLTACACMRGELGAGAEYEGALGRREWAGDGT